MGKRIEYRKGDILNQDTQCVYLEEIAVVKGHPRKAICRCGKCGIDFIAAIKKVKQGQCCRKCGREKAKKASIKYHDGDILNNKGSVLIHRIDGKKGIICCGECHCEYIGSYRSVAENNSSCDECAKKRSADMRRKYKEGDTIEVDGIIFSFEKELPRFLDAQGRLRRRGIFSYYTQNGDYRQIEARLSSICNGEVSGKNYSIGARKITKALDELKIPYIKEYSFKDLTGYDSTALLRFDFMVPYHNIKILIEFDGAQHYKPVKYFGGIKKFMTLQKNDILKNQYVASHDDLFLIRINYKQVSKISAEYIQRLLEEKGVNING